MDQTFLELLLLFKHIISTTKNATYIMLKSFALSLWSNITFTFRLIFWREGESFIHLLHVNMLLLDVGFIFLCLELFVCLSKTLAKLIVGGEEEALWLYFLNLFVVFLCWNCLLVYLKLSSNWSSGRRKPGGYCWERSSENRNERDDNFQ